MPSGEGIPRELKHLINNKNSLEAAKSDSRKFTAKCIELIEDCGFFFADCCLLLVDCASGLLRMLSVSLKTNDLDDSSNCSDLQSNPSDRELEKESTIE